MEKLVLTERFKEALLWSIELHANQTRKGSEIPYASHLLGVAGLVMENTVDEDVVIAALLHDAVEDTGGCKTLDEIKKKYGEKVANIVFACSDSWETPKLPYEERKAAYIKNLPSHSEDCPSPGLLDTEIRDYNYLRRCTRTWEERGESSVRSLKGKRLH